MRIDWGQVGLSWVVKHFSLSYIYFALFTKFSLIYFHQTFPKKLHIVITQNLLQTTTILHLEVSSVLLLLPLLLFSIIIIIIQCSVHDDYYCVMLIILMAGAFRISLSIIYCISMPVSAMFLWVLYVSITVLW